MLVIKHGYTVETLSPSQLPPSQIMVQNDSVQSLKASARKELSLVFIRDVRVCSVHITFV